MYIAVTVIHIIACLFLIGVVLLQQGKGADMGAVFGGSSQTVFGSSGAGNFLTRLTTATAVIFMLTSLTLAYTSARSVTSTVFDDAPLPVPATAPGEPVIESAPAAESAPQPEAAAPAPAPQAVAEGGVQMQPATGGVEMQGGTAPAPAADAAKAEAEAAPAAEAPAAPAQPAAGQ